MITLSRNPIRGPGSEILDQGARCAGRTSPNDTGPRRPRRVAISGAGSLAILIGGFYALVGSRRLFDNSFLTHLATGREILQSGLPETNPFLYSSTPFPVPSYWWSIILASVERLGDGAAIRLMTAVLAGLLGALIVRLGSSSSPETAGNTVHKAPWDAEAPQLDELAERTERSVLANRTEASERTVLSVLVPTLLATVCVLPFLNSRPQLPGFILLALAVLIWNERRSPLWLVPVFAAWVNIHGTWLYGIGVLGLFFLADLIETRRIERMRFQSVLAAVGGTILGGALYPKPFEIMLLPTRQFGNDIEREALRMYIEWRPVAISDPLFWLLIGLGIVGVYGNIAGQKPGTTRRWASAISAVGLVLMGLSGNRLVPVAAIALVPLVSSSLRNLGSIPMFKGKVATGVAVLGAALAMLAVANSFAGPAYDMKLYPVELVNQMEAKAVIGGEVRTLTRDYVGNYLEWRLGDQANTYVDDRPGAQTFLDYGTMLKVKNGWQDKLREADPDVIIWNSDEDLARELRTSADWTHVKTVRGWDLFCSKELTRECRSI